MPPRARKSAGAYKESSDSESEGSGSNNSGSDDFVESDSPKSKPAKAKATSASKKAPAKATAAKPKAVTKSAPAKRGRDASDDDDDDFQASDSSEESESEEASEFEDDEEQRRRSKGKGPASSGSEDLSDGDDDDESVVEPDEDDENEDQGSTGRKRKAKGSKGGRKKKSRKAGSEDDDPAGDDSDGSFEEEEEPTEPFQPADYESHPILQLKPGLLSFMLDGRCPYSVLIEIFKRVGNYAALKLADLFPDVFKSIYRERHFVEQYGSGGVCLDNTRSSEVYAKEVEPGLLHLLNLVAEEKMVPGPEDRRRKGGRRRKRWVWKGTEQEVPLAAGSVGLPRKVLFATSKFLINALQFDDPYWSKIVRQTIEEREIRRLSAPFTWSWDVFGVHRNPGNFDPVEYEVIRDHLQMIETGRQHTRTYGSGAFSKLFSRLQGAHERMIGGTKKSMETWCKLAEGACDTLFWLSSIVCYATEPIEPRQVLKRDPQTVRWRIQFSKNIGTCNLYAPELAGALKGKLDVYVRDAFMLVKRTKWDAQRSTTSTKNGTLSPADISRLDPKRHELQALSKLWAQFSAKDAKYEQDRSEIEKQIRNSLIGVVNQARIAAMIRECNAEELKVAVEPLRVRFDVADRNVEKRKDAEFKMRRDAGTVYGNFQIKDMDKYRKVIKDKEGNVIKVASMEVSFKRQLDQDVLEWVAGNAISGFSLKKVNGMDTFLRGRTSRVQKRGCVVEVRLANPVGDGYEKYPCMVISPDGSAYVTLRADPYVEFIERWNHNFSLLSGQIGHLTTKCMFCSRPLKGPVSVKRGYGPTCMKLYARDLELRASSGSGNLDSLSNFGIVRGLLPTDEEKELAPFTEVSDDQPASPLSRTRETPVLILDFGDSGKLTLYHKAWEQCDFVMGLAASADDTDVPTLPAGEMAGPMWEYETWKVLVDAVEEGVPVADEEMAVKVIQLITFLGDVKGALSNAIVKGGWVQSIVARMITEHASTEELRKAFLP